MLADGRIGALIAVLWMGVIEAQLRLDAGPRGAGLCRREMPLRSIKPKLA